MLNDVCRRVFRDRLNKLVIPHTKFWYDHLTSLDNLEISTLIFWFKNWGIHFYVVLKSSKTRTRNIEL